MKKIYILSLILFAGLLSYGQSFTVTYSFAGVTSTSGLTDPTPVPTAPGAVFGSFSVVNPNLPATVTGSAAAGRFSFPNQPLGAMSGIDTYSALAGTVDPAVYYQVVVAPASGQALSLSKLTFTSQRSGTSIRTYAVRSSLDNYATNLPASVVGSSLVNVQAGNVFFWRFDASTSMGSGGNTITLGTAFSNIAAPVTFRIYGYNAEASGGNFSIYNVSFAGSTASLSVEDSNINGLKVYPNPVTNGKLFIATDSNSEKTVAIFDVLGKQVIQTKAVESVNVSSLAAGVYTVQITEDGKTATRNLVIR